MRASQILGDLSAQLCCGFGGQSCSAGTPWIHSCHRKPLSPCLQQSPSVLQAAPTGSLFWPWLVLHQACRLGGCSPFARRWALTVLIRSIGLPFRPVNRQALSKTIVASQFRQSFLILLMRTACQYPGDQQRLRRGLGLRRKQPHHHHAANGTPGLALVHPQQ